MKTFMWVYSDDLTNISFHDESNYFEIINKFKSKVRNSLNFATKLNKRLK